jgi:hypothetical protein
VMNAIADKDGDRPCLHDDLLVVACMDMHRQGRAAWRLRLPRANPPVAFTSPHVNDDPGTGEPQFRRHRRRLPHFPSDRRYSRVAIPRAAVRTRCHGHQDPLHRTCESRTGSCRSGSRCLSRPRTSAQIASTSSTGMYASQRPVNDLPVRRSALRPMERARRSPPGAGDAPQEERERRRSARPSPDASSQPSAFEDSSAVTEYRPGEARFPVEPYEPRPGLAEDIPTRLERGTGLVAVPGADDTTAALRACRSEAEANASRVQG